ncbi:prepilin-type N-terminal cleavage/methylation domain-containing protein [Pseudomonas sp. D(2018)]|uniref:prepilin-type N-terminal cleavage/methylation domain-containing protein n=1 Tax=Pseudomonas sp. D(2018) TaxID=2502238 RepID=UPI0010F654E7|nr:prepilin-type N-terminal cleavage/methylation domain-containing protein [Pseudomonas sp. D(2018)]
MERRVCKQSAFTLLEVLVVLMLVSLVSALLMQALTYIGKVNSTFHLHAGSKRVETLAHGWFLDAVRNLVAPEQGDVAMRLRGDELSFEAVSLGTVDRRQGIPQPFAFRIEARGQGRDAELIYVRPLLDSRWSVSSLPADAHFSYLDARGAWHQTWPPSSMNVDQLPEAIVLEALEDNLYVLAVLQLPKVRPSVHEH